jgi:hypothetical protein
MPEGPNIQKYNVRISHVTNAVAIKACVITETALKN